MFRRIQIIFFLTTISFTGISQERYEESIFDEIKKETYTYATKDGEDLDLDLYSPDYDSELARSVLIFVHGGGFSNGSRDYEAAQAFCNQVASYGYVVASISYRLTRKGKPENFGCNCSATEKLNTFNAAVEDLQDATFFLIENRDQFAINPQQIILIGSSAGAETALNAAYQPPYCYGLDSGPVSYAGVISLAGAIPDTTVIYDESALPSLLFHGTDDPLVPYGTAPHHYCDKTDPGYLILHGANSIAKKLDKLETPYWLHTTCGMGHEMANIPLVKYFNEIMEFCYSFVIRNNGDQRHTIIEGTQNKNKFKNYNFCTK